MTYFFETYGCQMNTAESAALKTRLAERGWREALCAEDAALVIINTCSVRQTAEQRVTGRLAHYAALKKKNGAGSAARAPAAMPAPAVLVTGCMAARLGEKLRECGADFVMPAGEKTLFDAILDELDSGQRAERFPAAPASAGTRLAELNRKDKSAGGAAAPTSAGTRPAGVNRGDNSAGGAFARSYYEEGSFRSFVPVMRGCNNFCSYCIVPYVRGREASRPPDDIEREIALLAAKGVREITLLGQNVNSYRFGEGASAVDFPALLERVARWTEGTPVRRVRFLSSHPKDFSPRTIEALRAHPVFCRHIHLCAQHGSNRVLAAMNRRYTRETYLDLVHRLRGALPDLSLSTDILVGFPGETGAEFEEILTLMNEVKFLYSFMYHYNPREGTAAFDLPDRVSGEVKRERLDRVIRLQHEHTRELLQSRLGQTEEALAEGASKKDPHELLCRTERGEMVVCAGDAALAGSFIRVRLLELRGKTLRGEKIDD